MALTPEGKVKEAVKIVLKSRNIYYYMPVQNGMGVVGIPDFVCCYLGHFLAIETKAPGKLANLSANQQRQIDRINAAGGTALAIDDVAQLTEVLDGIYARYCIDAARQAADLRGVPATSGAVPEPQVASANAPGLDPDERSAA